MSEPTTQRGFCTGCQATFNITLHEGKHWCENCGCSVEPAPSAPWPNAWVPNDDDDDDDDAALLEDKPCVNCKHTLAQHMPGGSKVLCSECGCTHYIGVFDEGKVSARAVDGDREPGFCSNCNAETTIIHRDGKHWCSSCNTQLVLCVEDADSGKLLYLTHCDGCGSEIYTDVPIANVDGCDNCTVPVAVGVVASSVDDDYEPAHVEFLSKLLCVVCGEYVVVRANAAGVAVQCPKCGAEFLFEQKEQTE